MKLILEPDLGLFCACFCIEESTPFLRLLGAPSQNLRFSSGVTLVSDRVGRSCGLPMSKGTFVTSFSHPARGVSLYLGRID